jgi:hypothetical protein
MTTPTLAYITPHHNGYQVRLPRRVGGGSKFFSIPRGLGMQASQARTLKEACVWRDAAFEEAGLPITTRTTNDPNAGVFEVKDSRSGELFMAAVWMYEDKQMKRMFSIKTHGHELASIMAHMARDIGIRAEADRQTEWTDEHAFP